MAMQTVVVAVVFVSTSFLPLNISIRMTAPTLRLSGALESRSQLWTTHREAWEPGPSETPVRVGLPFCWEIRLYQRHVLTRKTSFIRSPTVSTPGSHPLAR